MSKRSEWTWKTADPALNARLHLKYEPGNWGDVLKGAWLVPLARAVAQNAGRRPVRYLDPFAGAPSYPLLDASAKRLEQLPSGEHAERVRVFAQRGEWPSCALLARDTLLACGATLKLSVFDAHELARKAWAGIPETEVLNVNSGEDAFERRRRERLAPDLVLVDSYDFFDHWGGLLAELCSLSRKVPVLVYIFNTAPRGAGYASQYERLRKKLAEWGAAQSPVLLGRLPYDKIETRAHHEVILLAPSAFTKGISEELKIITEELARRHAGDAPFAIIA
ncbi:MAG: hypothetical protein HY291_20250 [Planctomycetes bacterium]|nr:hypothetical protein [Planctomycetota bacterium]